MRALLSMAAAAAARSLSPSPAPAPLVVIMGATGTGKTKLSIDLAARFGGEVVNCDKIQVYRGLDITTNKVPISHRRGVPHHLLGDLDPAAGELSAAGYRSLAASVIAGIAARGKLPILAGGSNSFIHALLSPRYAGGGDPFSGEAAAAPPPPPRYNCCFLLVGVDGDVLDEHLDRRVEEMIGEGMVEELEAYFAGDGGVDGAHPGLQKAIGVPEFREHFLRRATESSYGDAVAAIKENTRRLAAEQGRRIGRLSRWEGWGPPAFMARATAAVRAKLLRRSSAAWERDVAGPAAGAVERFLLDLQQQKQRRRQCAGAGDRRTSFDRIMEGMKA